MSDSNTILTRQELFDLVWAKPVTHIAKEFGVQTATVLKACKTLNVPRPTTGHWVKLAHGQAAAKPPLPDAGPKTPGSISFAALGSRRRTVRPAGTLPQAPAGVSEDTIKWHPAVNKTRAAHRGEGIDGKSGFVNAKRESSFLNLTVTRDSFDRALKLLNKLAWALEELGFVFQPPVKNSLLIRLVYAATETEVAFQLKEEVERYERPLTSEEKEKDPIFIWNRWKYKPTGRLRLVISEFHPQGVRKSWGDGRNIKLESKLVDAAPAFVECAKGKHAQQLEWDARQRQWAEEARLRELEAARARKEQEKRDVLFEAAAKWRKAEDLMAFREACETRLRVVSGGHLSSTQSEWLRWVDTVICSTNPLTAGFLKRLEDGSMVANPSPG